jgi:hypothetical protein
MNDDEREIVTMISRPGDPAEPTISDVVLASGEKFTFIERPRDPRPDDFIEGAAHPCIPRDKEGICYDVDYTRGVHPKHPFCYEIMRVPGRTAILQHAADVIDQLEGCQAPVLATNLWKKDGIRPGMPHRDMLGGVSSVPALKAWEEALGRKNYRLIIKEA